MDQNVKSALIIGSTVGLLFTFGRVVWTYFSKSHRKSNKSICLEIGGTNIRVLVNEKQIITFDELRKSLDKSIDLIKDYKTKPQPEETIREICTWIKTHYAGENLNEFQVGVSMFGPIDLKNGSEHYGKVLNTPKPGWTNFHLLNSLARNLNINTKNIHIELDVNAAAYLEYAFGNHNVNSLAYITIGTGVGVGLIIDGKVNRGLEGPEGGHVRVKRHPDDTFEGNCPFHKDCLEGLITNGAIKKRKNLIDVDECKTIDTNDPVWDFSAFYLAQACLSLLLLPSVEKIIIGGGVANRTSLIQKTRDYFYTLNNNYVTNPKLTPEGLKQYIVRTDFLNDSGILSAYSII